MSDLKCVPLQLAPADHSGGDPGRTANAFYKVEGGKVVMYNAKGVPFVDADGRRYERSLIDSEPAEAIALRLARIINRKLSDGTRGFNGPINYRSSAVV